MAKRKRGFKSDKQRKAVMALLREARRQGLSRAEINSPPLVAGHDDDYHDVLDERVTDTLARAGWSHLGSGAARIVFGHPSGLALKISVAPTSMPGYLDLPQNTAEKLALQRFGGKRYDIRTGSSRYKVRIPKLFGSSRGQDDWLLVERVPKRGNTYREGDEGEILDKISERFHTGDIDSSGNTVRRGKTVWLADMGDYEPPRNKKRKR